ncbi:hypothetical protein HWV62_33501 [Athelia sp. TMB]|nr:hypothetical protein HWV62_33501 [Athelia sp. TMB]
MVVQTGLWRRLAKGSQCMFDPLPRFKSVLTRHFRIGWPIFADQPASVTHLAHNLDVAFELFEVRTGERGLSKIYRTGHTPSGTLEAFRKELEGVLKDMQSEVGRRKRANAQRIQQELSGAWQEGGAAKASFERFLEEIC